MSGLRSPQVNEEFAPEFQQQHFGSNPRYHSGNTHSYDNMASANPLEPGNIDFNLMQGL